MASVPAPDPTERARESSRIFIEAWETLNLDDPQSARLRGGLFEASFSGTACPFFNLVSISRAPESLAEFETAFSEILQWTADRKLPWILTLCHELLGDMLPAAGKVLESHGVAPLMPLTGMECSGLQPAARPLPPVTIFTEDTPDAAATCIRINEAAYGMTFAPPGELVFEHPGWWGAPGRMLSVAEADGVPVSCSAVLGVGGMRYVAMVATLPPVQRKGYGEAAMRDVLDRSLSAGLQQRTYLHASAAGRPVYERMGYTVTANYTVYVPAHAPEA